MTNDELPMHRVRLSAQERELLLSRFTLTSTLRSILERPSAEVSDVCLNWDEADDLREQAGDLFQEIGLDASMNATPRGKLLDSLIDKLLVQRNA